MRLFKENCHEAAFFARRAASFQLLSALLNTILPASPSVVKGINYEPKRRVLLEQGLREINRGWDYSEDERLRKMLLRCVVEEPPEISNEAAQLVNKYFTLTDEEIKFGFDVVAARLTSPKQAIVEGAAALASVLITQVGQNIKLERHP